LEDLLRKHKDVADVAVIGVKHDRLGEAPRAYIVPKSDSLTADHLNKFVEQKVAAHKRLNGGIEFVTAIPKAASGKILRRQLLDDYLSKTKK